MWVEESADPLLDAHTHTHTRIVKIKRGGERCLFSTHGHRRTDSPGDNSSDLPVREQSLFNGTPSFDATTVSVTTYALLSYLKKKKKRKKKVPQTQGFFLVFLAGVFYRRLKVKGHLVRIQRQEVQRSSRSNSAVAIKLQIEFFFFFFCDFFLLLF